MLLSSSPVRVGAVPITRGRKDSVCAVSQSDGHCDSYCDQRVLPSNPLRAGYAQRGACLVPLNATGIRGVLLLNLRKLKWLIGEGLS